MKFKFGGLLILMCACTFIHAQSPVNDDVSDVSGERFLKRNSKPLSDAKNKIQKAQMRFIGTFESGYKDAGIYKMVDLSDDVICYILMPDNSSNRVVDGKLIYEGNNVGSISCVKGR